MFCNRNIFVMYFQLKIEAFPPNSLSSDIWWSGGPISLTYKCREIFSIGAGGADRG